MLKLTLLAAGDYKDDCWVSAADIVYITTAIEGTTIGLSSGVALCVAEAAEEIVAMLTESATGDYEQ